jgi:DNA-binding transcriptional MerR regulator
MPEVPPDVFRYHPMTVGQVADVAGVPRETLRTWLRNPIFEDLRQEEQEGGWRRFTDFEAINIAVYAALVDTTRDLEAAEVGMLLAADCIMKEWVEIGGVVYMADSTFKKDRFLFFWRSLTGKWKAEIADMGEEFNNKLNARIDETYSNGSTFLTINLGRILRMVHLNLLRVQISMQEKQK